MASTLMRIPEQRRAFEEVLSQDPKDAIALAQLGFLKLSAGAAEEAVFRAVTVPTVNPSTPYVSTPWLPVPDTYTLSIRTLRVRWLRSPWLSMRMPRPEEFPPVAQRQMQAQQAAAAEQPQKKRRGLIERLASVGLGRREIVPVASRPQPQPQPEPVPAPVAEQRSEPRMQAIPEDNRAPQPANVHPLTPSQETGNEPGIDPALDDDQLEIPAFLRRQAN